MTEPMTYEQHLAAAQELAAKADELANHSIASEAERNRQNIMQVVARGRLHLELARELKPGYEVSEAPSGEPAPALETTPAPPTSGSRQRQRRGA